MIRRDILKSIGGFLLGGFASGCAGKGKGNAPETSAPEPISVDVLVTGGGTAGVIAAIQAARAGASTRLIELGTQLGGTMTTGGVCFPGLFHAWGRQIIAGIGWDLVKRTVELHGGALPDFNKPYVEGHWEHQVLINAPLYTMIAEQACLEAGVSIHYNEFALSVEENERGWLVETAGPGIRAGYSANR